MHDPAGGVLAYSTCRGVAAQVELIEVQRDFRKRVSENEMLEMQRNAKMREAGTQREILGAL